jgi:hypothetical protein
MLDDVVPITIRLLLKGLKRKRLGSQPYGRPPSFIGY